MPIRGSARFELTNLSQRVVSFYYQIDYTMEPDLDPGDGYLHVSWRRENPTTMLEDFTIVDGIAGPGRFLGCSIGVRVLDQGDWYGEGEVKVFRDGDDAFPTICGTGLEDYVGTAWTMGAHAAPYAGSPLEVRGPDTGRQPDLLSFYRWHVLDPIMFESELRITIQQIGAVGFAVGDEARFEAYAATHPVAGPGWHMQPSQGMHAFGIVERVDDYCAAAWVYAQQPQPVPRLKIDEALAEIERRPFEQPHPFERGIAAMMGNEEP